MRVHRAITRVLAFIILASGVGALRAAAPAAAGGGAEHAINVLFGDIQWQRIVPELGDRSSEIAILHVDPDTSATQLMIRVPRDFHVPRHWHSANETHTVVDGTFVVECDGERVALGKGSFNYVPARRPHEAWTTADEGALLFITVDAAWDINWVDGVPKPGDFGPGLPASPAAAD